MTYQAFQEFDWEDIALEHRDKLRGFSPSTTGMHVHMSKNAFTDNHLLKFMTMIYEYKSFTCLISQRDSMSRMNQYARFKEGTLGIVKNKMSNRIRDVKKAKRTDPDSVDFSLRNRLIHGDKYASVNLCHSDTVEVRVFKSNLIESSFRKNVEYLEALYHFTYNKPFYELKLNEFVDYIRCEEKQYRNLNTFLDSRKESLDEILRFPLSVPDGMRID